MGCIGEILEEKFVGVPDLAMGDMLLLSSDVGVAGGSYRATASSDRHRLGPGLLLLGLGRGMERAMASNSSTCFVDESSCPRIRRRIYTTTKYKRISRHTFLQSIEARNLPRRLQRKRLRFLGLDASRVQVFGSIPSKVRQY